MFLVNVSTEHFSKLSIFWCSSKDDTFLICKDNNFNETDISIRKDCIHFSERRYFELLNGCVVYFRFYRNKIKKETWKIVISACISKYYKEVLEKPFLYHNLKQFYQILNSK